MDFKSLKSEYEGDISNAHLLCQQVFRCTPVEIQCRNWTLLEAWWNRTHQQFERLQKVERSLLKKMEAHDSALEMSTQGLKRVFYEGGCVSKQLRSNVRDKEIIRACEYYIDQFHKRIERLNLHLAYCRAFLRMVAVDKYRLSYALSMTSEADFMTLRELAYSSMYNVRRLVWTSDEDRRLFNTWGYTYGFPPELALALDAVRVDLVDTVCTARRALTIPTT
jgi:hypothetical protein